jgi:hypothetical protein
MGRNRPKLFEIPSSQGDVRIELADGSLCVEEADTRERFCDGWATVEEIGQTLVERVHLSPDEATVCRCRSRSAMRGVARATPPPISSTVKPTPTAAPGDLRRGRAGQLGHDSPSRIPCSASAPHSGATRMSPRQQNRPPSQTSGKVLADRRLSRLIR